MFSHPRRMASIADVRKTLNLAELPPATEVSTPEPIKPEHSQLGTPKLPGHPITDMCDLDTFVSLRVPVCKEKRA